jgi:hypothetical protein
MRMPYGALLSEQRIRPLTLSEDRRRGEIGTLLELAQRELTDSGVEALSLDGRYEHAYSAVRALAEVGFVGCLGWSVPVARPDALAAGALEGETEAAYAAEKVNELQFAMSTVAIRVVGGRFFM